MATPYTVDASVFLSAFNRDEAGHADSQRLLAEIQDVAIPIVAPTLLLPELAASADSSQPFRARWPRRFYFHTNPRATETWLSTVERRAR